MTDSSRSEQIFSSLEKLFPDAHCQLDYGTVFQLTMAVMLSAQTTDVAVNRITPYLFEKYPDARAMASAQQQDVEEIIRSIGLYRNKARNLILMAQEVCRRYAGQIPDDIDTLTSLPGVGRKTANVIMSEGFGHPAIAVDTHVHRVSCRLGLADKGDSPDQVEMKLQQLFPREKWSRLHHLMIFFGRYMCHSRKPECSQCPFRDGICTDPQ